MNAGATKSLEQKHDNANISLALGDPKLSQTACDADLSGSDINDHEVVGMVTVDVEANQRKNRRSLRRRGTAALHSWASRLRYMGVALIDGCNFDPGEVPWHRSGVVRT